MDELAYRFQLRVNGLFCESMVKGFQGENLSDEYKIAACVKHFAGYGAPTAGRDYNTVELSEHTFREFYLPSYKAGIDAGAALVMTSFNTVQPIQTTKKKIADPIFRIGYLLLRMFVLHQKHREWTFRTISPTEAYFPGISPKISMAEKTFDTILFHSAKPLSVKENSSVSSNNLSFSSATGSVTVSTGSINRFLWTIYKATATLTATNKTSTSTIKARLLSKDSIPDAVCSSMPSPMRTAAAACQLQAMG